MFNSRFIQLGFAFMMEFTGFKWLFIPILLSQSNPSGGKNLVRHALNCNLIVVYLKRNSAHKHLMSCFRFHR